MFRKPRNVIEAIQARQFGCPKQIVNEIFEKMTDDRMLAKGFENIIEESQYIGQFDIGALNNDGTLLAFLNSNNELIIKNILNNIIIRTVELDNDDTVENILWSPLSKGDFYMIGISFIDSIYICTSYKTELIALHLAGQLDDIVFHPTCMCVVFIEDVRICVWYYNDSEKEKLILQNKQVEQIKNIHYSCLGNYVLFEVINCDRDLFYVSEVELNKDGIISNSNNKVIKFEHPLLQVEINKQYTVLAAKLYNEDAEDNLCFIYSLKRCDFGTVLYQLNISRPASIIGFSPSARFLFLKDGWSEQGDFNFVDIAKKNTITFEDNSFECRRFMWSSIGIVHFMEETQYEI